MVHPTFKPLEQPKLKTEARLGRPFPMRIIRSEGGSTGTGSHYYTGRSRLSSEMRKANQRDGEHIHLMTQVSTVVLAGEVEVLSAGNWERIGASSGVVFDTREPHDVRTREDAPVLDRAGLAEDIVAITMTERIVPPSLDLFEEEIDLVVREDRFDPAYLSDPRNPAHWSNGLRVDPAKSQHFFEILGRNRKKLDSLHRVLNI
jgi:hypothetical protein